jgi:hypothetical protein
VECHAKEFDLLDLILEMELPQFGLKWSFELLPVGFDCNFFSGNDQASEPHYSTPDWARTVLDKVRQAIVEHIAVESPGRLLLSYLFFFFEFFFLHMADEVIVHPSSHDLLCSHSLNVVELEISKETSLFATNELFWHFVIRS